MNEGEEDAQDFAGEWMVALFFGLHLEKERGREESGKEAELMHYFLQESQHQIKMIRSIKNKSFKLLAIVF